MTYKVLKRTLISFTVVAIGLLGLYIFMTYDRVYTWSKEYKLEIQDITDKYNFTINNSRDISTDSIKLPIERIIKINIQRI